MKKEDDYLGARSVVRVLGRRKCTEVRIFFLWMVFCPLTTFFLASTAFVTFFFSAILGAIVPCKKGACKGKRGDERDKEGRRDPRRGKGGREQMKDLVWHEIEVKHETDMI